MPEEGVKTAKDEKAKSPPDLKLEGASPTDEDVLRLRSRLAQEFGSVAHKLADAEQAVAEIEAALRAYEDGTRGRPAAARSGGERATERITARLKAMGDGLNKIKDWVAKPLSKDKPEGESESPADARPAGKKVRDLQSRLDDAVQSISEDIREKERQATEADRLLHEAQKELIRQRANEQHVREMQIRIGQTKQLSEDLERKMAMLDEMVKTFETSMKSDTGIRPKPKDAPAALPKLEDRLQGTIDQALKAVSAQEKRVADQEKDFERAQSALVEERARQQRMRGMQVRLRQIRHFATDLHCSLGSMGATLLDLGGRVDTLLRPEKDAVKEPPAAEAASVTTPAPAPAPAAQPPGKK